MKRFSVVLCSSLAVILSLSGLEKSKETAFDADLFRRDLQVFSIHTNFLFWRVQEGSLDFALTMKETGWGPSQCYANGKFQNATFHGDPGFRIAASFFRAPKFWEVWGQYTRLTAAGSNRAGKPTPDAQFLTGTWPQIFTAPMSEAHSYIHMNYNVADLMVDRVFHPNPHLRLRLMGAGVVAWINQFWKIQYLDSANDETTIANRWQFTGGGLRVGTSLDWYWFFKTLYITGGASFATLLGSYQNKSLQTTNFSPTPAFNPERAIRDTCFRDVRAAFSSQFFIGPSYQKNFSTCRLELFAGYEVNVWMNLQEIFRSTQGSPSDAKETRIDTGTIALQGLTSRITIDF